LGSRAGWLRALVLGADDAIVSTASLMIGIAASSETSVTKTAILIAGVAALVAGALSMAVGEFVSVSSQRDTEQADIAVEQDELAREPAAELDELARIYMSRGLDRELALAVAKQLSSRDQLAAHLRDELGIDKAALARPLQAAWISAASFASFALLPIGALLVAPRRWSILCIASVSLASLGLLGAFGGYLGGASRWRAGIRVTIGGALAMGITAGVGRLLGVAVN